MSSHNVRNIQTLNKPIKRFIKHFEPLEIIEPYEPDTIDFNTPEDFNAYYHEHEDEFLNKTTYKLNKKYRIPGYKITQPGIRSRQSHNATNEEAANEPNNGPSTVLKLLKDYRTPKASNPNDTAICDRCEHLETVIKALEERLQSVEAYLQQMQ